LDLSALVLAHLGPRFYCSFSFSARLFLFSLSSNQDVQDSNAWHLRRSNTLALCLVPAYAAEFASPRPTSGHQPFWCSALPVYATEFTIPLPFWCSALLAFSHPWHGAAR
jgi:hypothetical protein